MAEGYFEKHINRMRNHYRTLRDALLKAIRGSALAGRVTITAEHAGLHFLMEVDTPLSDEALLRRGEEAGLRLSCVSQYYFNGGPAREHVLVMNYAGLTENQIPGAVERLCRCLEGV